MSKIKIRQKKNHRPRKRSYRWLLVVLLGAGVVFCLFQGIPWLVTQSLRQGERLLYKAGFQVRTVWVEGRQRTSSQDLLQALSLKRGDFFFQQSPQAIQKRLEALPWVRSSVVERRLPDTFYIRLAERRPLAFWQKDGEKLLIDGEGSVIPCPSTEYPEGLLTVVGKEAPKAAHDLLDTLAQFPGFSDRVIAAVRLRSGRWDLYLKGKCLLKLPFQNIEQALKRFLAFEERGFLRIETLERIDLRFQDRLILRQRTLSGPSHRV